MVGHFSKYLLTGHSRLLSNLETCMRDDGLLFCLFCVSLLDLEFLILLCLFERSPRPPHNWAECDRRSRAALLTAAAWAVPAHAPFAIRLPCGAASGCWRCGSGSGPRRGLLVGGKEGGIFNYHN